MARLHFVKKARKSNKAIGVKKGESYFWWKFAYGPKRASKTRPRRSQLTQSSYYGSMYDAEDDLADAIAEFRAGGSFDELESALEEAKSAVENAKDECESNKQNMPDALQESATGELLQSRVDACEALISDIDDAISAVQGCNTESEDAEEAESERDEAASAAEGISWEIE